MSLVTKNLQDYILYTTSLSSWEIHNEFEDTVFTINGTSKSLFNFVFCNNESSVQKTLNYLKKRKIEATWLNMNKKILLERYGIQHASTPKKAFLNIENYILPADLISNLKLKLVDNSKLLEELDSYTSHIFHHDIGAVSTFFRGLQKDTSKLKIFLIILNYKTVGTCGIFIQEDVIGFYSDGVLPMYRNQGIGTQMVLERIKIAKELKCKYVIAHCMKPSINLYKRLGFQILGNIYLHTSSI